MRNVSQLFFLQKILKPFSKYIALKQGCAVPFIGHSFYLNSTKMSSYFTSNSGSVIVSIFNSLQIAGIFLNNLLSLLTSVCSVTKTTSVKILSLLN
jgi:hypothetical protein